MTDTLHRRDYSWIYDLLLIVVLLGGAYLRAVGMDWDQGQHLHPDERFLTMVESALQPRMCLDHSTPVELCPAEKKGWIGLKEYFNTAESTLNPNNRGYGFYVYGTWPIFIVRYVAEWLDQSGYDQVYLIGRQLSALADLGTILLLYFIAARLYGRKTALLAAAFSALAVLQIQQAHFFTVDTFANFFLYIAILFAVEILLNDSAVAHHSAGWSLTRPDFKLVAHVVRDKDLRLSLFFGLFLGMAAASKINTVTMAILLPAAFFLRVLRQAWQTYPAGREARIRYIEEQITRILPYLVLGGLAFFLAFRTLQPYAFSGPGFFGLKPNPQWIQNLASLRAQSTGDVDFPPALQWARRSHLFSFKNLTIWGVGLPLGITAWLGVLLMGWRILRGQWQKHTLLWGWTLAYFLWQSMAWNPTMRYQLPIYPLLAMMAAWGIFELKDSGLRVKKLNPDLSTSPLMNPRTILASIFGITILVLTASWAFAFTRIYTRDHTRVQATRWIYQNVPGPINLRIQTADGSLYQQPLPFPYGASIQAGTPFDTTFTAQRDGTLQQIFLPNIAGSSGTLSLVLSSQPGAPPEAILATATLMADFTPRADPRGEAFTLTLNRPVSLTNGAIYYLRFETTVPALTLSGASPVNESSWDDGLPLRMDGYDGFGGLYNGGLNFEMYFDDNADKLARFQANLDQGDYIFISSNRQWATTVRVPERYPLTTAYYRALIGCPAEKDIIWCYNVAQPGDFQGQLGYDLVQVFESFPTLGSLRINDQFAEEAFTVYDHPKVLIFQKRADYDAARVHAILSAVDLSRAIHLTPRQAASYPHDLTLPPERLAQQQAGGTWSEIFNTRALHNRYPVLGLLLWYVFIFILGLFTYPLMRLAFPGLADKGYPLSRAMGLVLLAWMAWMSASIGAGYTREVLAACLVVVLTGGAIVAWFQRTELSAEWKLRRREFLLSEALFLAFFVFDLLIRLGNPDLWHPAKGGERPMDFSYFNAILKSTSFPPYDPWYAGGYINYYYYGFVLVATPLKLLGIVPAVAYNFILPTLFAVVAMGAFSLGWNLLGNGKQSVEMDGASSPNDRLTAGLAAALGMVVLGNLGTVRMIYQGFQRVVVPDALSQNVGIFVRLGWAVQGLVKTIGGAMLPYGRGDWYWFPSRVIPAPGDVEPITEFPFFTFLYSDLHAHMLAMPLALLVLAWSLSVVLARGRWAGAAATTLGFFFGGLTIGALYPTNLSDIYTYLPIGLAALGYTFWRYSNGLNLSGLSPGSRRLLLILVGWAALILLSFRLYQPYRHWYAQAYSQIDVWIGSRTPIWSYLTHWGLFLFVIVSWLAWETRQWMAVTPVSAIKRIRWDAVFGLAGILLLTILLLAIKIPNIASSPGLQGIPFGRGVTLAWLILPLAAWAGLLLLRRDLPDAKRLVLFWIGTALVITLVVEIVVVRGDIGRMNTVFKFYLQAWTLLAVSSGAGFGWLLKDMRFWKPRQRDIWQVTLTILVAGTALFTLVGTTDKVLDRMSPETPHTLDSMQYMRFARYADQGLEFPLQEDYEAIRWMQENVKGSPVIVEANCPEYRWCTRYTIYTGLPGVLGWNWHQRQQRALNPPNWVTDRVTEINEFYTTSDLQAAYTFLKKYNVRYIVVGWLERAYYPDGIQKFEVYDGQLWTEVFRSGETAIYEVK
jgi:YYY domain-containing protein